MAKINEQLVVVKMSKLVRDTDDDENIAGDDVLAQLEEIIQELVPSAVVEIIRE